MSSTIESLANRDIRQRDLVPPQRLSQCTAVVIGVGAIGRQVALQLAAIGIPAIELNGHGLVAGENLAPQGYWREDLGPAKVSATGDVCRRICPELQLTPTAERFRRSFVRTIQNAEKHPEVVCFCCVDSI